MLHERIKLIQMSNTCPRDLVPVVATLIWASARVDIPELMMIRKQFRAKYGKTFEADALRNVNGILNERVVMKLSVEPPAAYLVQTYLERICEQFQVDWKPSVPLSAQQMAEPMAAPVGYSVAVAQGTGLGPVEVPVVGQTTAAEEEDALKRQQNGGIPPPVVTATAVTPMVPPPPNGSSGASNMSSLTGVGGKRASNAPPPAAAAAAAGSSNANDFAEPDIYIPGPPTAPPGSGGGAKWDSKSKNDNDNNDDDDDNDNNNNNGGAAAASGGAGGADNSNNLTSSYADLAARFENLKR